MVRRWAQAVVLTLLQLAATACSSPTRELSERAAALGLLQDVLPGSEFQHVVFHRAQRQSRTLHIYIDGDGTPWLAWRPAADPTPRNSLVLELMALDSDPSLYLGRPCYHGLSKTPACASAFWTSERYSDAIVSSMAAALRRILKAHNFDHLIWFGYSGGGTLAVLLAPRFPESAAVVTVAANLDIDAWTDWLGYSRLVGSLNPARQPPMPAGIRQRHYVGGEDRVVPKYVVARGVDDTSSIVVIANYDHVCCWINIWPVILREVEEATAGAR